MDSPRSMTQELFLLGSRLSMITFAASFVGLVFVMLSEPSEENVLLISAAFAQSICGLIVCNAALQIDRERSRNKSDT